MRRALCLLALSLAGCAGGGEVVREFGVHIGWSDDGHQYVRPEEITVRRGDLVRLVVTNDDDPTRDYNGDVPGRDNYHDLVVSGFDADGDGSVDEVRHEAAAGQTVVTSFAGRDHFKATQAGTFAMACEVMTSPSHATLGMAGRLVVT